MFFMVFSASLLDLVGGSYTTRVGVGSIPTKHLTIFFFHILFLCSETVMVKFD